MVWSPTHTVSAAGTASWDSPDPSRLPTSMLAGGAEIMVEQQLGDWILARTQSGSRGWVDGRQLIAIPQQLPPAPQQPDSTPAIVGVVPAAAASQPPVYAQTWQQAPYPMFAPPRKSRVPLVAAAICFLIVLVVAIGIGVVALQPSHSPSQGGSGAPGGNTAVTPNSGAWEATAEWGTFRFVVNDAGTGVNEYDLPGETITTTDPAGSFDPSGYPIRSGKWGSSLSSITIQGQFDSSTTASGTWKYVGRGGSGTWTATWVG
jgi:hypothetical protein